jgi:dGTP triphosphohydrolase
MEVAAISRNIARALGVNENLAETIALAHDLGHSPFGHKGEAVLNRLMKVRPDKLADRIARSEARDQENEQRHADQDGDHHDQPAGDIGGHATVAGSFA